MHKGEAAGSAVTFGRDVLQDQAQECHTAERAGLDLPGLAVLITNVTLPLSLKKCLSPESHPDTDNARGTSVPVGLSLSLIHI